MSKEMWHLSYVTITAMVGLLCFVSWKIHTIEHRSAEKKKMVNVSRKKFVLILVLLTMLSTTVVYAIVPLVVGVPVFAITGQGAAVACDTDGVVTSYTYGATRPTGVKVATATVTGVNTLCQIVTVTFLNNDVEVVAYSGTNTTGTVTVTTTNIWTNEFTAVRVTLLP